MHVMPYWSSVSPAHWQSNAANVPTRPPCHFSFPFSFPRQRKVLYDRRQAAGRRVLRRTIRRFQNQRRLREVARQLSAVRPPSSSLYRQKHPTYTYISPTAVQNITSTSATSKDCWISCSASLPRKPSRLHSPSGPPKNLSRLCFSGTCAPPRCARSRRWT